MGNGHASRFCIEADEANPAMDDRSSIEYFMMAIEEIRGDSCGERMSVWCERRDPVQLFRERMMVYNGKG